MNSKFLRLGGAILFVVLANAAFYFVNKEKLTGNIAAEVPTEDTAVAEVPTLYGIPIDTFETHCGAIQPNEFLGEILARHNIDAQTIHQLASIEHDVFNPRRIKAGNNYCILSHYANDTTLVAKKFIYEANKIDYVIVDLNDSIFIDARQKEIVEVDKEASGIINSSLYMTMLNNDINPLLAYEMADIYAWTIDFYRINKGDKFKVLYTERFVDGESIGIGDIKGMIFNHGDRDLYAFQYEVDSIGGMDYYDADGENLRRAFLKAPVKYSRISSRYTKRRFHPVQKRYKAHLGTDYAAPHGTPIYATADGMVIEARYKKYNGNYVKIRHNGTYMTQYLHMSGFAKGVKPGKYVAQGEVIGYVGSTGLATGPHVCYRFWKNKKQVDPYKQDLPSADPIPQSHNDKYFSFIEGFKKHLDEIDYPSDSSEIKGGKEIATLN